MEADHRSNAPAPLVLVVEDDESNRELFQLVLGRAGMRVLSARDVDEARTLTAKSTPDLVVTDVRMPLGDGAAFIRDLRTATGLEDVPILLVTALLEPADNLRILEDRGPVDAVLKPFKPDVLVNSARSLLARAALVRASAGRETPDTPRRNTTRLRAKAVLLIEDDSAIRYAMRRMLRGACAAVVEAANLEGALSALDERPEIEAVVAEVVLPDGLAPDALKPFEQRRRLPVLYVTGYSAQFLLREYGLSAQDPHLLVKPFDASTLVSRLAALEPPPSRFR